MQKIISIHLGNGASMAAVNAGAMCGHKYGNGTTKRVLVMGTRFRGYRFLQ